MAFRSIHKIDIADSATIVIDLSTGHDIYNVSPLMGNRTLSIINSNDNDSCIILIQQDGTGGRTLTFDGSTLPINTTAQGYTDLSFLNVDGALRVGVYNAVRMAAAPLQQIAAPVISITSGTGTPVTLDWADITGAESYTVQRATDSAFTANLTTVGTPTTSSFSGTPPSTGVEYFYRVVAVANGTTALDSNYSNTVSVTIPVSYDTDAQAYFTASGITDPTTMNALNSFMVAHKAHATLHTKKKTLWFMLNSLAQSKFNFWAPVDTDAGYRLTQTGSGTFSNGFTNTLGSGDGLDTKITPNLVLSTAFFTRVVSVKTDAQGTKSDFGVITGGGQPTNDWIISRSTADQAWARGSFGTATADIKVSNSNGVGRYYLTTKSGGASLYKNGSLMGNSAAYTPATNTASKFYIGNGGATPGLPSDRKISFAGFYGELTAQETADLDALFATLETALGR